MHRTAFMLLFWACTAMVRAQTVSDTAVLRFSGYVDVYYAYDFGHSADDERPRFLYQYDRHSEVDLNLGMARVDLIRHNVRAAFGLMAGTYAQANTINEPDLLQNIYEARIGMKLSRTHELWLDAGVFSSHIGMESAIGIDNWTLTRSIVAENSPYYETGAKVTWTMSPRWEIAGMFLNGWQRMRRVQNNIPCFGTQVLHTMPRGMKLNWSTFAGSDTPDSLGLYRVFNNFWWSWEGAKWGVQLSGDLGVQEALGADGWDSWGGVAGICRRRLGAKLSGVLRAEYYTDPEQVIVPTGTPHGLTTVGYSLGLDLKVMDDAFVRLEGRTFHGVDAVFESISGPVKDNTSITVSMAARF
ncbi:MAG: porin [Flavobacteriales bacterium]|nr:porin [Flavobacteriales bacterium]